MHKAFLNRKNLLRILCISIVKKLLILLLIFLYSSSAHALAYEDYPVVKLRSLDKITARTMTFEAKVGSTVRFGEIFIKVQACRKPPPVEKSEAAAFLQVWQSNEVKNVSKWIFSGWMFSSSPGLSAMDHPVYDVWVLDCLGRDPEPVPVENTDKGVPAPATDGVVPNAVPPAVQPDKQPVVPPGTSSSDAVTCADDPGACDEAPAGAEAVPEETAPATNIPSDAAPANAPEYKPTSDAPDTYQDETPSDDSSPQDDTISAPSPRVAPVENLEPKEEPAKQQFEGIY